MTRHQTNQARTSKAGLNSSNAINQSNHHHAHRKIIHIEPFSLHSPDNVSLKKAAKVIGDASLNRHRVCVVSVISKDALEGSTKDYLARSAISNKDGKQGKRNNPDQGHKIPTDEKLEEVGTEAHIAHAYEVIDDYENQVIGQVDTKLDIIVLNLTSFMETDKLHLLSENISQNEDPLLAGSTSLFNKWPLLNQNLLKTLLILLTLSHVVVFYCPEVSLDLSLIHMLKVIDKLRLRSETRITDLLESIASKQMFPAQWIRQGRVACPRALFICDATHLGIQLSPSAVADARRDLEDQIYKLLKRLNIINRSATVAPGAQQPDLLYLPDRGDFVFVLTQQDNPAKINDLETGNSLQVKEKTLNDFYRKLFESLDLNACNNQQKEDAANSTVCKQIEVSSGRSLTKFTKAHGSSLKKFLHRHISEIQGGFKESELKNSTGRSANQVFLPRYDDFFSVLLGLETLLFPKSEQNYDLGSESKSIAGTHEGTSWEIADERRFVDVYDLNNNDELFSKVHCSKTRLAALEYYVSKVTKLLDKQRLEGWLSAAVSLYQNHARGSACESNQDLLLAQCSRHNASLYEGQVSRDSKLLVNGCSNPSSSNSKPNLTILRRSYGIKMTTSCECGRQTSFSITPVDRKKRLERINIARCDDDKQ